MSGKARARTRAHAGLVQAAPQLLDAEVLFCPRPSLVPGDNREIECWKYTLKTLHYFNLPTVAPPALPPSLSPSLPVRHGRPTWVELGGAFQEGHGRQGLVVGLAGLVCDAGKWEERIRRNETYIWKEWGEHEKERFVCR